VKVRIPGQFVLWAPSVGPVLGTAGLSSGEASTRLLDRVANGSAFPGERVVPLKVEITIGHDLYVRGHVVPLARRKGALR